MSLDLRSQAQRKAPVRQSRQGPGTRRRDRRAARKRHRHGRREFYAARRLRRERQHDKRIVLRFRGQDGVIAELFGEARILRDARDVERRLRLRTPGSSRPSGNSPSIFIPRSPARPSGAHAR
jgi:hypothetical protein